MAVRVEPRVDLHGAHGDVSLTRIVNHAFERGGVIGTGLGTVVVHGTVVGPIGQLAEAGIGIAARTLCRVAPPQQRRPVVQGRPRA